MKVKENQQKVNENQHKIISKSFNVFPFFFSIRIGWRGSEYRKSIKLKQNRHKLNENPKKIRETNTLHISNNNEIFVKHHTFSYLICVPRYSSNRNAEGHLPSRLHSREGQCDFCLKCGGFRVFRVCGSDRPPSAAERNHKP